VTDPSGFPTGISILLSIVLVDDSAGGVREWIRQRKPPQQRRCHVFGTVTPPVGLLQGAVDSGQGPWMLPTDPVRPTLVTVTRPQTPLDPGTCAIEACGPTGT
jgi:hypothetical protein